jgi:potassium efflux system protein
MIQQLIATLVACALLAAAFPARAGTETADPAPPASSAAASTAPVASPVAAAEAPAPDPWIAPEDIADRADALAAVLEAAMADETTAEILSRIGSGFDADDPVLAEALATAAVAIRDRPSMLAIQDAYRQVRGASGYLPAWQEAITSEAKRLTVLLEKLERARGTWSRTLTRTATVEAGEAVVSRVERSVARIDEATAHVTGLRVKVLALSDRLVDRTTAVRETLHKLENATRSQGMRLLVANRPPLWRRDLGTALGNEWPQVPRRLGEFRDSTWAYLVLDGRPFILQGLLAVALLLLFRQLPEMVRRRDAVATMSENTVRLLTQPYAMALLLAMLPSPAFHPSAPRRVTQLIGLLALLAVARVLRIVNKHAPLSTYAGVLLLLVADRTATALSTLPTVSLLLFLFEITVGWSLSFASRRRLLAEGRNGWMARLLGIAQWALAVALLAEIGGWSSLAALTGRLVLISGITGIMLYAATISVEALMAFALASRLLRSSRFVDRNQELVQRWSANAVKLVGFAYWLQIVLGALGLTTVAGETLDAFLATGVTAGALSISIGGTLAFVLTLVAVMIANRFLHEVLEDEVFPRTNLPRGIPDALLALSRYTIWSLGFLLALAAAGVQMGQLSILLGGLGVGIGLGLQDVVKNFAAGLTLLLERRVHVGDAVQIQDKDVFGRVRSIGIRASVIRNWNGTEVVIPNDDLVSGTVTNWTLSDQTHRLEVPVGVAYGVDPEAVIALLLKVASEADYLLRRPPPTAVFKGFGESSLDFMLRGWTDEDYEQTGARTSQLGLAVHRGGGGGGGGGRGAAAPGGPGRG